MTQMTLSFGDGIKEKIMLETIYTQTLSFIKNGLKSFIRILSKMVGWIKTKIQEWKAKRAFKKRLKELREKDPFIYD